MKGVCWAREGNPTRQFKRPGKVRRYKRYKWESMSSGMCVITIYSGVFGNCVGLQPSRQSWLCLTAKTMARAAILWFWPQLICNSLEEIHLPEKRSSNSLAENSFRRDSRAPWLDKWVPWPCPVLSWPSAIFLLLSPFWSPPLAGSNWWTKAWDALI